MKALIAFLQMINVLVVIVLVYLATTSAWSWNDDRRTVLKYEEGYQDGLDRAGRCYTILNVERDNAEKVWNCRKMFINHDVVLTLVEKTKDEDTQD